MDWSDYDAALFDLDGVITPTAEVHMHAWAEMFGAFLAEQGVDEPYTDDDYFQYVDGKPRYDGVRSFLASRGIELPEGDPSDAPTEKTVSGLGNRKNDVFEQVLQRDGLPGKPAPDTFLYAAEQLGAEPSRAVVLEDALSGVAAGKAGHFGLVVGVDRGVGAEALTENGADQVVTDLEELL